jgi:SynChlorMet cassette protein ScmC
MSQFTRGYALSLSDGRSWWITSDGDNFRYVDKLAAIMELEESIPNGSTKLVYSSAEGVDDVKSELMDLALAKSSRQSLSGEWTACDRKTVRIWNHSQIDDVVYEIKNHSKEFANTWYSSQAILLQNVKDGGLPIHAALLELDGRGVLLSAPSGTGKSTCCRRLPEPWKPLCDDAAIIVLDREKQCQAQPFPTWSDYLITPAEKTWNVQYSVPIYGIFFLEQSERDEVVPLGTGQTAVSISNAVAQMCRSFWRKMDIEKQRSFREQIFDSACKMATKIPGFCLRASLCGKFWVEIEKACKW